jgi:hypothetical protein
VSIALIVTPAACYSPYEPVCGFVCGTGGACPADYTCASDNVCHLNGSPASTTCPSPQMVEFDVTSAMAYSSVAISITYSAVPNAEQAQDITNYTIPGLTLTGESMLAGSTIRLGTTPQSAVPYTVTIANVTRITDMQPLTIASAMFAGRPPFDVASAAAVDNTTMTVTFDGAPDATTATALDNYVVPGLTLGGTPVLAGDVVTLATSSQLAQSYTVTVANVTRASDFEPLTTQSATFDGRSAFDVASAAPLTGGKVTVTFDAPPDMTSATTLANYSCPGLTLSGTPALAGMVATITTSGQTVTAYTITVANVTRASDGEPLSTNSATFTGINHCTDSVLDGDETDVDCGGPTCAARCGTNQMCSIGSDCASNNCPAGTCQ